MSAPAYTAEDYRAALQALLPRGRVWPRDPESTLAKALLGLCAIYERSNARANYLLVDAFPATTYELLPEWEATLGLPDPCVTDTQSIAQRVAAVKSRFTDSGGQSVAHFIAIAQSLGIQGPGGAAPTITEFKSQTVIDDVDEPIYGQDWAFAWQLNAALNSVFTLDVTGSVADPLASWSNEAVECRLKSIKAAHTEVLFAYT